MILALLIGCVSLEVCSNEVDDDFVIDVDTSGDRPVFSWERAGNLSALRVAPVSEDTPWDLSDEWKVDCNLVEGFDGSGVSPTTPCVPSDTRYGVLVEGSAVTTPHEPLTPGHDYEVFGWVWQNTAEGCYQKFNSEITVFTAPDTQ